LTQCFSDESTTEVIDVLLDAIGNSLQSYLVP
jgi:hypothetical protein